MFPNIIDNINDKAYYNAMTDVSTSRFDRTHHRGDEPHLLREVLRTHQVLLNGFSRKTGIQASRFVLLRLLAVSDEKLGIMDLARRLGINASAVTRQVQEMEQEGLVVRRADPRDRRRVSVRLSPKGKKLFAAMHERHHELERALSKVLSEDEVRTTISVLTRLRAFIEGLR